MFKLIKNIAISSAIFVGASVVFKEAFLGVATKIDSELSSFGFGSLGLTDGLSSFIDKLGVNILSNDIGQSILILAGGICALEIMTHMLSKSKFR